LRTIKNLGLNEHVGGYEKRLNKSEAHRRISLNITRRHYKSTLALIKQPNDEWQQSCNWHTEASNQSSNLEGPRRRFFSEVTRFSCNRFSRADFGTRVFLRFFGAVAAFNNKLRNLDRQSSMFFA